MFSNPQAGGGGLFGSINTSTTVTNPINPPSFASPSNASYNPNLVVTLASHPFQYIQQSYNADSPGYRFRAIFYNYHDNASVVSSAKPVNMPDERLWAQALADNPDPQHCIPVIATGPEDLHHRSNWQHSQYLAHNSKATELVERLAQLKDSSASRGLRRLEERQAKLGLRVLKIQERLEPMRRSGSRLDDSERILMDRIGKAQNLLAEQAEIKGILAQLELLLKDSRIDLSIGANLDPQVVAQLATLLNTQTITILKALEKLSTLNKSLDIISSGYSL